MTCGQTWSPPRPAWRLAALALSVNLASGCVSATGPMLQAAAGPRGAICRSPIAPTGMASLFAVAWKVPFQQRDRDTLDAWCSTTGPPVVVANPPASGAGRRETAQVDELVVVSWNLHVGGADLAHMVERLRSGEFTGGVPATRFVLLLQEAYRDAPVVPRQVPRGLRTPKALGRGGRGHERTDVVRLAASLGLSLYYAPSMRNGSPSQTTEDRGNAILSTEPLSEFGAIELPFERQRRVAVTATVSGHSLNGDAWTLRVASVHLDNTASARHLWIMADGARARQARGLLEALAPHDSLIVGGDFNTWFGFSDPTYKILAATLPDAAKGDGRRTFRNVLRLDHLFAKPPEGWTVTARRLDQRMGSDHYPILAHVRRPLGSGERQAP